jgi:hypothetical protein
MPHVPEAIRPKAEEIIKLTDAFCTQHLDGEYSDLCRKLDLKLARKRPSPLARGEARIWAGGAIYVVGRQNFLFDPSQRPHLRSDQLSQLLGVPPSTLANKAKLICDNLKISPLTLEFSRREMIEQNPIAWMISVNGFLIDARTAPPEIQAEARRLGLIPDLALPSAQNA